MPEGHVIRRLADAINEAFAGEVVEVTSPQGRFGAEAAHLNQSVLIDADAIGKHLFITFDVPEPRNVHVHLGLIGKFNLIAAGPITGAVRLRITDGAVAAELRGPQWCRLMTDDQVAGVISGSGPDPLREDADPEVGWLRIHNSAKPIGQLLMDQQVAAGVGNIYRAEVLFRHRLDPMTPGKQVKKATWNSIWADLVTLMRLGVRDGRIDTVLPEHEPEAMGRPPREDAHGGEVYVYRRAGQECLVCGTPVRQADLAGRNLYWCPRCQRRHS